MSPFINFHSTHLKLKPKLKVYFAFFECLYKFKKSNANIIVTPTPRLFVYVNFVRSFATESEKVFTLFVNFKIKKLNVSHITIA
jgi:hypothetical protein